MSEYRPDQEQYEQQQPETRIEPALVKKLLFPLDSKAKVRIRIQPEALEAASYLLEQFIIAARERASIDAQFDAENDDIADDIDDNKSSIRNGSSERRRRQESNKSSAKRKRSAGVGIGGGTGTNTGTGTGTSDNIIDIANIDEEFNTDISSDENNGIESNSDTDDQDLIGHKERNDTSSVELERAKRARKDHSTDVFIRPKHIMNIAAELLLDFT